MPRDLVLFSKYALVGYATNDQRYIWIIFGLIIQFSFAKSRGPRSTPP